MAYIIIVCYPQLQYTTSHLSVYALRDIGSTCAMTTLRIVPACQSIRQNIFENQLLDAARCTENGFPMT